MPGIEVRDVVAGYGDMVVLRGLSASIKGSGITAIIGPNGAGKTTLLRTISGLIRPVRGRILFEGEDITGRQPHKIVEKGIAHVPEGRRIFPELTVLENLLMGAFVKKAWEKRLETLEIVYNVFPRLRERRNQLAGTLSGGEQQMLAIARALMSRPRTLLLDEPSQGLAPIVADQIYKVVQELSEEIAIAVIEQMAWRAINISDYIYAINMGRVVAEGEPSIFTSSEELRRKYLEQF